MTQHTTRKPSKSKLLFLLLLIIAMALICKSVAMFAAEFPQLNKIPSQRPIQPFDNAINPAVTVSADRLYSPHAILVSVNDHTVLLQKSSETRIYPASLTKMMTTLVAIENLPNLQKEIKISDSVFQELYNTDATMAGFQPGEKVSAIDLLYGVMLPSGAECCIVLADHISGSEAGFVELMNQKAADLGMSMTHYSNATGLHDKNHYTTVRDLSVLLKYALQNDTFKRIFCTSRYTTKPTRQHPDGITFHSTMFEKVNTSGTACSINEGRLLGGKTGYTEEAGLCLASYAVKGGKEYILITAGAKGNHKTEQYNIKDAFMVYNSIR